MISWVNAVTIEDLKRSLCELKGPPEELPELLKALWYDAKGDWNQAHGIAQGVGNSDGSWVHAYLHRKEGDLGNARYWYGRADRPESKLPLQAEWEQIAVHLCKAVD